MAAAAIAAGWPKPSPIVPLVQVGSSIHSPLTGRQLLSYCEQYWHWVPAPHRRVSDDIRIDLYTPSDFPYRFQQRFSKEIILAHTKEGEEYRKMLRKARAAPEAVHYFLSNEWFFEATNAITLDELAPRELHSGLKGGIDWPSYLHQYNMGVHEYIMGEKVDRSIVINYQLLKLQRRFIPNEEARMHGGGRQISGTRSRL